MDINDPIPVTEVNQMSNEVSEFQSNTVPQSPLMQVIEEAELNHVTVSLMQMINSLALHDADLSRERFSDWTLQYLFDSCFKNSENFTNDVAITSANGAASIDPDMLTLIESANNMPNRKTDTELVNTLNVIMSRGGPLSSN